MGDDDHLQPCSAATERVLVCLLTQGSRHCAMNFGSSHSFVATPTDAKVSVDTIVQYILHRTSGLIATDASVALAFDPTVCVIILAMQVAPHCQFLLRRVFRTV
jgi:hypothetical protein